MRNWWGRRRVRLQLEACEARIEELQLELMQWELIDLRRRVAAERSVTRQGQGHAADPGPRAGNTPASIGASDNNVNRK